MISAPWRENHPPSPACGTLWATDVQIDERRGPIAILATDPARSSWARTFARIGRSTLAVEGLHDWTEAEQWLTAQAMEGEV
jgi:hypothetical protein